MSDEQTEDRYQSAAFLAAVAICIISLVGGAVVWFRHLGDDWQVQMLKDHYAAIVGLPAAAAASFVIVTFFRQVAGRIKIKGWGLDIQGAGGPVLLWVACFMAITTAIWMIWGLKP